MLVALVLLAAAFWPSATLDSYLAAKPCEPTTGPANSCKLTLPMTIIRVDQTYGRGGNHYHYLLGNGWQLTTARVDAFLWWIPTMRAGDTVKAETWSGKVTRLTDARSSYVTSDSPLARRYDLERAAGYLALFAWLPFGFALLDAQRRPPARRLRAA